MTAEAARPGTTYFAPGVRLVKLHALQGEPNRGTPVPADVQADVLRVEVTRVHTGGSQYTITLNNWYTTTAADRRDPDPLGAREVRVRDLPRWPRYKYNDFALLAFGNRLRIDMGYWPDPAPGLDAAAVAAQNWVPMVAGPITDMKFTFSSGEGGQVTISGEDDLSRLKDKVEKRVELGRHSERNLVLRALAQAEFPLDDLAAPRVAWPAFATDESHGIDESIQDGQSCLDFLQKLADRLDFEVFLEFADLTDPGSPLAFHFEPARSRLPPDRTLRDIFVLRRETNLIDFSPTIKVVDQYSHVTIKGRHRDRNRPERVDRTALASILDDELHGAPEDPPLKAGPEVRERFFPGRPNPFTDSNQTNTDPERAEWQAQAVLRRKARELLTISATTLGLPRLRPGGHVEIRGFRPPFDGFYYVTQTVHTYGTDGLRTKFTARRPGMPLPPYGEK